MPFMGAFSYGAGPSAAITSTTATEVVPAPAAGYRNIVLSARVWNSDAVDSTTVQLLSGSTIIDGGPCAKDYGSWFGDYTANPLKCAAAEALKIKAAVGAEVWYAIRWAVERITE